MKKRIMLILAVGVSFTPAVFARYDANDPRALGPKIELTRVGEQLSPPAGSFPCNFSKDDVLKGSVSSGGNGSESRHAGSARTSGSARSK